jgi:regulator of replication initiation timing
MPIMNRPKTSRSVAVCVLALLTAAGAATAQSDADLRRENQRLRTQVNDQKRELDAARNRITQLELEVEKLRQLLNAAPPTTAEQPAEEKVTIDETVPHASPRALLKALQDGYLEAMLDVDPGDPATPAGSRQRAAYLRDLHRWARRMNREMKTPIEWHIRIAGRGTYPLQVPGLVVEAVDPKTHVVLGDPFPITLPQATVRRLRDLEDRGQLGVLVVKGVLIPQVMVNPDRHERGLFDKPRFVGPFAEFEFLVEASSVTPPPKPKERPPERATGRS